jgi:hypothetical protein
LANIQRPLRRSTAIDPAELELSRTRTLDRLNAIADHEPTRTLDKGETDMADAPATNDANDPGVAGASQSAIEPTESRPFRWLRQPDVRSPSSADHPPVAPPAVIVLQGEVPDRSADHRRSFGRRRHRSRAAGPAVAWPRDERRSTT